MNDGWMSLIIPPLRVTSLRIYGNEVFEILRNSFLFRFRDMSDSQETYTINFPGVDHPEISAQGRFEISYSFMGDVLRHPFSKDNPAEWSSAERSLIVYMAKKRMEQDPCRNAFYASRNLSSRVTIVEREKRNIPYVIDHTMLMVDPCTGDCDTLCTCGERSNRN